MNSYRHLHDYWALWNQEVSLCLRGVNLHFNILRGHLPTHHGARLYKQVGVHFFFTIQERELGDT